MKVNAPDSGFSTRLVDRVWRFTAVDSDSGAKFYATRTIWSRDECENMGRHFDAAGFGRLFPVGRPGRAKVGAHRTGTQDLADGRPRQFAHHLLPIDRRPRVARG